MTDAKKYIEIQLIEQYKNHPAMESYPRGIDFLDIPKFNCNIPTRALSIDWRGDSHICTCEVFLPISVGKITEFDQLEDIWQSEVAKELQKDIMVDRRFTNCAVQHCGILKSNQILTNYLLSIDVDESCNLACPSCRRSAMNITVGPEFDRRKTIIDHILNLVKKFDKPITITTSGGDIFASTILRPLFLNWEPKDTEYFMFQTNGLLLKKLLSKTKIASRITDLKISIDAGSKEVYEVVRKPGKFQDIEYNLKWLSENRHILPNANISLKFVLQSANAGDLINFAALCRKYNFFGTVSKLDDWGTWDNFSDYDVIGNINHPKRQLAKEQIKYILNEYSPSEIQIKDNLNSSI